ncbi:MULTISPECIES: hypothetical protein [Roseateles]|uniref:Uncharacterized protein n=1 Tax=Roseateles albus TaxID=2987525 RepID=A0ABT5KHK6_9BURK|nr:MULTISPECIES: hypothetical protein [Roseateles]MCV2360576.1 hypothetical protein [Paucibacter sp. TC2R-5]MDC8773393.1 hypothetical protein [Roseateles albus]
MTDELNACDPSSAGERPAAGWRSSADFHVEGLGAIGFESACPALLGALWPAALDQGGAAPQAA